MNSNARGRPFGGAVAAVFVLFVLSLFAGVGRCEAFGFRLQFGITGAI